MSETRQARRKREKRQGRERVVRKETNVRSSGGSWARSSHAGWRPAFWRGAR